MYFIYLTIALLIATPASAANQESLDALKAGDFKSAAANAETKTMYKLATYLGLLENPEAYELAEFAKFIKNSPKWPFLQTIRANSGRANMQNTKPAHVVAWFKKNHPKSEIGAKKFLIALESLGKVEKTLINKIWTTHDLDLKKHKKLLTYKAHQARVTRLLDSDKLDLAKQMLPHLNKKDALLLKAKLALRNKAPITLPSALANDKDYLFEKLKFYRTSDDLEGGKILLKHRGISKWFPLRLYFDREALRQGKPQLAYDVMIKHGAVDKNDRVEAEWFRGWVALRFLHKPELALQHFKAMQQVVGMPQNIAKAHFWLAQTYKALNGEPAKHFKSGAKYGATFYGQMCAQELDIEPQIVFRDMDSSSATLDKSELVQAVHILKAAGMAEKAMPFLYMIGKDIKSREAKPAFIKLVKKILPDYTVRAIKQAHGESQYVYREAYPILPIKNADPKLVLAIIRQESEFDGNQISYAGAMGLMQLMPPTAERFAKKIGIAYNKNRLTSDPNYNITIGVAYLQDKLNEFPGSLVPPVASYNAGHKPVYRWIEQNGPIKDDSTPTIDWVDWVEKISYGQTREYVQKVLANYKVYGQLLD